MSIKYIFSVLKKTCACRTCTLLVVDNEYEADVLGETEEMISGHENMFDDPES
jgi:hypothetical protein